ncbi:MAG: IPT/TIG domain-containing protein [Bacteroidia bacterium]|nr:IPT/TIG domain-containing protein [Bacteroidia bacterium]
MTLRFLSLLVISLLFVAACSDDDTSTPFTPSVNVSISSVVPLSGPAGATVTIKGSNFGTNSGELSIKFGGIAVTPTSLADTEMKIRVPAALPKGNSNIEIQRGTGKKVTLQFTVEDPVVGIWTSQGQANVAPLLYDPPLNIRKIVATFKADGSYIMVRTDSNNVSQTFTGTYVAAAGNAPAPNNNIRTIVINQSPPNALTVEGIYEITVLDTGVSMNFEVVQTDPPIGIAKPTPAAGFGSTGGGSAGPNYIQKYLK